MVTSRTQRRWVLPKGHIEDGLTPWQAAEREAWEEAGLRGTVISEPLGTYHYIKHDRRHAVTVYRIAVIAEHDLWPERLLRQRQWVTIDEAIRRVKEKGLKELLKAVDLTVVPAVLAAE